MKTVNTPIGLKIFAGVVIAAVIAVVGYGIYLVGSPTSQRAFRFDDRRVSDLQSISSSIDSYWDRNSELPARLEDLQAPQYYVSAIEDPETGQPYEYNIQGDNRYELCAVFSTDSSQRREDYPRPFSAGVWDHGVGRVCFDLEAQPLNRGVTEKPLPPG